MEERQLPTAEDVVKKIKDDGDFDTLRLKIIRVVKENEELRKSIIDQVKRSDIVNKDGSEDMKPRQLSDAIYEELGRKITGQISDEIWKTIRLNESIKDDIKGTVEHVFNKIVNPKPQTSLGSNPSLTQENQILGREANGIIKTSVITPTSEANISNSNKTYEPPGFGSSGADSGESKNSDLQENEKRLGLIQNPQELLKSIEDLEGGGGGGGGNGGNGDSGEVDDDTDLPPGFN